MILADTNILGTLARISETELLFDLFSQDEIGVAPADYAELLAGVREGRLFLQTAVDLVESTRLKLLALTADEVNDILKSYPVVIEIPVAWGEMDAMQHVNNIVYFRYIESARMAFFERVGLLEHQHETGVGPILAWTSCRFRRALAYPDRVSVGTRATKIEADRFTMHTRIVSHAMNDVAAESEGIVVTFNYREQKKAPIPLDLRRRIEELGPPA